MAILEFKVVVDSVEYDVEIHEDDLKNNSWVGLSSASARAYADKNSLSRYDMNCIMAHRIRDNDHYPVMIKLYGAISKLNSN